jgi:hypothetical protein
MADRRRLLQQQNVSFGSAAADYSTTTSADMKAHPVPTDGRRQVNLQRTNFQLGDDAAEFVSARMAEEGSSSKQLVQRLRPGVRELKPPSVVDGPRAAKDTSKASWTLGSSKWAPETSASTSFQWPEPSGDRGDESSPPRSNKASFQLGDDAPVYASESQRQFAVPEGGGRQAAAKPGGGSVAFGSDAVSYATSTSAAFTGHIPTSESRGDGSAPRVGTSRQCLLLAPHLYTLRGC